MMLKEIAKAYAEGKRVQWRRISYGTAWIDYAESPPGQAPLADPFYEWRVVPDVKMRYRVALTAPGGVEHLSFAQSEYEERAINSSSTFIRWVTDWIPVTVDAEER